MLDFPFDILILVGAGLFAGFVNTMAGGGSLLTLPLLIFLGLPPATANGTNRIAIIVSASSATLGFRSKNINTFPLSIYLGLAAFFGALIGSRIAVQIDGILFNKILAIIMIIVVVLMVFKPNYKSDLLRERTTGKTLIWSMVAFFFIGIYGGFINAGIGFIIMLFLNYVNKLDLVRVNATKVTLVLIYTTAALATFILSGHIDLNMDLLWPLATQQVLFLRQDMPLKKGRE